MELLPGRLEPGYDFLWRKPGQPYIGAFVPIKNRDPGADRSLAYRRVGLLTVYEIMTGISLMSTALVILSQALSN